MGLWGGAVSSPYKVGDIVRHRGDWLRSVGWVTGVPVNGRVQHQTPFGGGQALTVEWSDGNVCMILGSNVELCPRAAAARRGKEL